MKIQMRATALLAAAVVLGVSAPLGAAAEENVVFETPKESPNPDRELVAKANGWTPEQAAAQEQAADAVGALAVQVAKRRPDIFVGSALSETPGDAPTLFVKGPADDEVLSLVRASGTPIRLADRQPYSFEELEARSHAVHMALLKAGFRNIVTGTNIEGGGVIPASVGAEPGLVSDRKAIAALLPAELRDSVELTIDDPSGYADTASAFGGMWVRDDGANECTSGWTVRKWNGSSYVYGVTTAGHCDGINQIYEPGVGTHTFVLQDEHRGAYGDVEWHTSNAVEDGRFYAGNTTIRPALYLEARAGISVNETVCQYGRASNFRDCDFKVHDVSIECTLSGVYNNRLVQMNGKTSTFGDSGGPWFYDYKAYGSQKGWCSDKDAWSVADLYDSALGVEFVIYE